MGFLRLVLAISVVLAHSHSIFGLRLVNGFASVQTFFIISGFYMSLILNEKYVGSGSYWLFFSNRVLRLFPTYWLTLIITLFVCTSVGWGTGNWLSLSNYTGNTSVIMTWRSFVVLAASNLFILGQDVLHFFNLNPISGDLEFAPGTTMSSFLLVPQAWSIGIELLFYAIAPFIVRKSAKWAVVTIIATSGLRFFIYRKLDENFDPWLYRFFPTQLGFFLLGNLSYKGYVFIRSQVFSARQNTYINLLILLFLSITILFQFAFRNPASWWFYYIASCVILPFLFLRTKTSRIDRYIGELSYPVYIIHIAVLLILTPILKNAGLESVLGLICVLCSVLMSVLINRYLVEPIEAFRQRRANASIQASAQATLNGCANPVSN